MTIWLWWHDRRARRNQDFACPYVHPVKQPGPVEEDSRLCTCVDNHVRPIPGRWREFREVLPLPKEEDFECL